jgi:hypothetical protein
MLEYRRDRAVKVWRIRSVPASLSPKNLSAASLNAQFAMVLRTSRREPQSAKLEPWWGVLRVVTEASQL